MSIRLSRAAIDALENLSSFIERHKDTLEEYKREIMRINHESESDAEFLERANALRYSERHNRLQNIRETLVENYREERAKCMRPEDSPLYTDVTKPKEPWLILLDDKNFDLASATTLQDREKVRANLRMLADQEDIERRANFDRAQKILRMQQRQRSLGILPQ